MPSVYFPFTLAFFTVTSVRGGRILLALYALHLGAQPLTVGLIAAMFSAPPMLLSYQIGKLTDRFGTRWLLLIGISGSAMGLLVPYFVHSIASLFIAAVLNGVAFAFFNVSLQNTVGLLSTEQTRVRNYANFTLVVAVAQFIGPLLVGFSIDHSGHVTSCIYVIILAAVPVLLLAVYGRGLPGGTGKPARAGGNMLELLSDPAVRRVLAISSLMMTGYDLFLFYMPIYAHSIGHSASTIGIIVGAFSAAAFVVRLLLSRLLERFTVEQVLTCAFYVGAGGFTFLPFIHSAVLLCALAFVFGLSMSVGQPITMTLSFSNAAEGRSGEAMGMRQTINHLTRVVGPLAFGSIGSAFGLFPVFWINALMLVAGGLFTKQGRLGGVSR